MRKNGHDWIVTLTLLMFSIASLGAQWNEVRFGMGELLTHVIGTDDGRGLAFFSDVNSRVVITRDNWRTFDTVVLPAPEAPYIFEPYSYDTTANGTVVVVGQHRPPRSVLNRLPYCNTTTAAYYSTDWGLTWSEVLPRRPGRYMSVSYRGRSEGVLLYENEWMDSVEFTPQKPTYRTYGREVVLVDQQLSFLDRNDIDKADTTENRPIWGAGCLEGYPRLKSYIDRINDSILVMATISPCVNNYDNETDPSGIMRQPSYKTVVSTDLGATWKENLGIWNPRDSNGSDFGRMKIVDDTTWIDHQGNFYEGIRTAPRKVECPLIKRSDRYWAVSDALDRKHLMLTSWSILDSVRKDTTIIVHNEHEMSLVTLPACTLDPLPVLKRQETFYDGYRGIAGPWKLVLMKNGEAIIARCAGSESLKTRKRRFEWSLYILTKSTSSAETLKISSVNAHEIRDGIVFFSKACIDAGTLEYYSLYGAVAATVAFEAGSRQSNIPSLSPGVYFVHLRNEVPLKFVVQ